MTRQLKLSCADFAFPLLAHEDSLRLIQMLGIEAVDLGLFSRRSHLQPEHIAANPVAAGRALIQPLHDLRLQLSDVFVQLGPEPGQNAVNEPSAQVRRADRERFRQCIDFAVAAGCRHMTGLPGVPLEGQPREDSLSLAIEETAFRMAACNEAEVQYSIEAHVGSLCPTPAATLEFLRRLPGLTLTLDYGHFIYQNQNPADADALLPHAAHFHARAAMPGRLQTRLAKNQIDFAPLVWQVLARPSVPWICIEYVWVDWEGCNEVDNVSETILMRRHLKRIAEQLREGP